MSNPWAQSFEDLRSPYLQEKKAKKDYDGDGKIESGAKEYRGVVHNKIQKAKGGKADGQDTSSVKEHHQKDADGNPIDHGDGTPASLDELSNRTMRNYIIGGTQDLMKKSSDPESHSGTKYAKKMNRRDGISRAGDKLARRADKKEKKEEISYTGSYLDELSKKTLGSYVKKASKETRGNMIATQRGSGIPKKARDIKQKQVFKRLKGMEKAGEKMSKESIEFTTEADKKGKGSGSKDACYHKVKSRYSVWPSAYASGALVKCRKVGAKNWGNSSKKEEFDYYQMPMKSFGDMVGECWKTHEQRGMKMKGGKMVPNCVPKGSPRKEEVAYEDHVNLTGNAKTEYDNTVKRIKDPNTPQEVKVGLDAGLTQGGHSSVLQQMMKDKKIKEAVKSPKLDIKETGVKNKIEINPEIKTEAAKAPVKK